MDFGSAATAPVRLASRHERTEENIPGVSSWLPHLPVRPIYMHIYFTIMWPGALKKGLIIFEKSSFFVKPGHIFRKQGNIFSKLGHIFRKSGHILRKPVHLILSQGRHQKSGIFGWCTPQTFTFCFHFHSIKSLQNM